MAERVWFRSDVVTVGSYRLAREEFRVDRPPGVGANLIVFPRSTHEITPRRGGGGAITDRNSVLLYNRGESYRRRFIDPVDRCDFLAFTDEWALEIAGQLDPAALQRPTRPFDRFHAPADPAFFWAARRLIAAARAGDRSPLAIEEEALGLARRAFAASRPGAPHAGSSAPSPHHVHMVEDVKAALNEEPGAAASLAGLARSVGASPAHLSRVFRRVTGTTVHSYRTQLRLRASVDHLPGGDLSALAAELGFSSHSHFTATFRSTFHRTPSQARAELAG